MTNSSNNSHQTGRSDKQIGGTSSVSNKDNHKHQSTKNPDKNSSGKAQARIKQENLHPTKEGKEIYPNSDNIKEFLVDVDDNEIQYMPTKKLQDIITSWNHIQRMPIRNLSMTSRKELQNKVQYIVKNHHRYENTDFSQFTENTQTMLRKVFTSPDDFKSYDTEEITTYLKAMVTLGRINKANMPEKMSNDRPYVLKILHQQFPQKPKSNNKRLQDHQPSLPNDMDIEAKQELLTAEEMANKINFTHMSVEMLECTRVR